MRNQKKTAIATAFAIISCSAFSQDNHYAQSATGLSLQRSDSTGIQPAFDANTNYAVPNNSQPCAATTATWSGNGASCSAAIPATASGAYAGASSSNGNPGTAQYSCSNGVFTGISATCAPAVAATPDPTPTPAPTIPASKDCGRQTVTWPIANFCSGTIQAAPEFSVISVTSNAFHRYGTGTFQCFGGTWKLQNNTCY